MMKHDEHALFAKKNYKTLALKTICILICEGKADKELSEQLSALAAAAALATSEVTPSATSLEPQKKKKNNRAKHQQQQPPQKTFECPRCHAIFSSSYSRRDLLAIDT